MDFEKLREEVKKEGFVKPEIVMITPEIRTVDEYARSPAKVVPLEKKVTK